jgi:hypothetical protein
MTWLAARVARLAVAMLAGSVVYLSASSAHAQDNTGRGCLPAPAWVSGPVGDTTNTQPTLSWAPVPGATGYTLYVRDAVTEEWFLRRTGLTTNSYTPPSAFPVNMLTNWKVKATKPGCEGLYANGANYRILYAAQCPPTIAPWTYQDVEGPINDPSPTFRWTAVPGATEYVIALLWAPDDGFYVFGHADSTEGLSYNFGNLPVGPGMRWKVKTECDERYGPFTFSRYFNIVP